MNSIFIRGCQGDMRLKKWNIDLNEETITGLVSGSRRYPDGTGIRTSRVIAAAFDGDVYLIRTQNSTYECFENDFVGDPETLLIFNRTIVDDQEGTTQINFNLNN